MRLCEKNSKTLGSRTIRMQRSNDVEELDECRRTDFSFWSSAVRPGRTVSSISFSRNAASYFPRPRLRSQTTTSMMRPRLLLAAYHPASGAARSWEASGFGKARGFLASKDLRISNASQTSLRSCAGAQSSVCGFLGRLACRKQAANVIMNGLRLIGLWHRTRLAQLFGALNCTRYRSS